MEVDDWTFAIGGIPEEGTDVGALEAGYVSIPPLQLDMTMYSAIPALGDWKWKLNGEGKHE